jgi:lipoprotein-releasing system ATP-binding protein
MILQASNLSKRYGDLTVLKQVSLQVDKGEFIAIVGPSGAGKSTLLHLLGLLDHPDSGQVVLLNEQLGNMSKSAQAAFRNRNLGFVFQFHYLLPEFTALENVCMPLWIAGMDKKSAAKQAEVMLQIVGLSDRLHHKPGALSGGEQQRVAIARAIVHRPAFVMADEPTGNLDTANAGFVHQLFFDLRKQLGLTFIVVTHNEDFAAQADRAIFMKDGSIIEDRINKAAARM